MDANVTSERQSPTNADAQRGENDGRACRRLGHNIPSLSGGAYAVGFLYGYAAEGRQCDERDQ